MPRNRKHRVCRIDANNIDSSCDQKAGENSSPATHIEQGLATELFDDPEVVIQITAVRVEIVINRSKPRAGEDLIRHSYDVTA